MTTQLTLLSPRNSRGTKRASDTKIWMSCAKPDRLGRVMIAASTPRSLTEIPLFKQHLQKINLSHSLFPPEPLRAPSPST